MMIVILKTQFQDICLRDIVFLRFSFFSRLGARSVKICRGLGACKRGVKIQQKIVEANKKKILKGLFHIFVEKTLECIQLLKQGKINKKMT